MAIFFALETFFDLTENKEAALGERIPAKTIMSLRTALRHIKKEEAENSNGAFFFLQFRLFQGKAILMSGIKRNMCCL